MFAKCLKVGKENVAKFEIMIFQLGHALKKFNFSHNLSVRDAIKFGQKKEKMQVKI